MTEPTIKRNLMVAEALMPEPVAFIAAGDLQLLRYGMHSIAGARTAPDDLGLYTADQMREMYRAATERAAKLCEEQGDFYLATHNRQAEQATDACAAAIRASSGKGEA